MGTKNKPHGNSYRVSSYWKVSSPELIALINERISRSGALRFPFPASFAFSSLALALRLWIYETLSNPIERGWCAAAMAYRYTRYTHLYFIIWIRVKRERSIVAQNPLISSFGALNVSLSHALYKPHQRRGMRLIRLFLRTMRLSSFAPSRAKPAPSDGSDFVASDITRIWHLSPMKFGVHYSCVFI